MSTYTAISAPQVMKLMEDKVDKKEKEREAKKAYWANSKFYHIINWAGSTTGSVAADFIKDFCKQTLGLDVGQKPTRLKANYGISPSEFDLYIKIIATEVKASTNWTLSETNWSFTFQQIRNQSYDRIIFVGIDRETIYVWWATKEDVIAADLPAQHTGKSGKDTRWLTVEPNNIPSWFRDMETWPTDLLESDIVSKKIQDTPINQKIFRKK